jgi:hypothetical protein
MPIVGSFAGASARAYGLGAGGVLLSDFESIATATPSSVSTFTFSSIPQTYKHLQIRYIAKGTSTSGGYPTGLYVTLNADTTANYNNHNFRGDGASAASGYAGSGSTSADAIIIVPGKSTSNENLTFGVGIVDILDYANTNKLKTLRGLNGGDFNGSGSVFFGSSLWRSTSAITSITFTCDVTYLTNFLTNSHFALYGVKA